MQVMLKVGIEEPIKLDFEVVPRTGDIIEYGSRQLLVRRIRHMSAGDEHGHRFTCVIDTTLL